MLCVTIHSLVYWTTRQRGPAYATAVNFVSRYQVGGVARNGDEQHARICFASENSSCIHGVANFYFCSECHQDGTRIVGPMIGRQHGVYMQAIGDNTAVMSRSQEYCVEPRLIALNGTRSSLLGRISPLVSSPACRLSDHGFAANLNVGQWATSWV